VAQIPESGYMVLPFRDSSGTPLPLGLTGAVILLLLSASWVQAQNPLTSNSTGKSKPSSAVIPVPAQEVAPPPVVPPPSPPRIEQKPPQQPTIAWDGKQLTIDADNSTLAAVLRTVRERTGASIEIPGAASEERVFVHLGPGPARDIISSLLYGTSFDYIIEAADDDPDTLRRVVLTSRGLGDNSGDVVVAGAAETGEGSGPGGSTLAADAHSGRATEPLAHPERVRMMPGWSSPGKPTYQAEAEAALAAQLAAAQDAAAADTRESAPNAQNPDAGVVESQAANSDPPSSSRAAALPASSISETNLPATTAEASSSLSTSLSTSNSDDPSGVGSMIQNMNRMFEQRRQLQVQQNQGAQRPSSN